jgi:DNA-binding NtrC family response regulator
MKPRMLVVDDNRDLARGAALALGPIADVDVAFSGDEALARLASRPADVVFTDVRMPGMDGTALLDVIHARHPRTRVVLFTGFGTIASAVDAMRRGAFHYLTKPFDDDELVAIAERAWSDVRADDAASSIGDALAQSTCFHGICTRDRRMHPVLDAIRRVAPTTASVLLVGESGTGKELVARALHAESGRRGRPFVAFSAAAMPETLADAELFGSRRGAYTGADRDRPGLFVEASGGTLFIDELSSMPLPLQNKLLRAIQEREVRPLGASGAVRVDVRIVAATNADPMTLVAEGALRKDLYYRLAVVRIGIPPLRERPDDVPLLAALFLDRLAQTGLARKSISAAALRALARHAFPGNVRELQNVIERAALLCRGDEIGAADVELEHASEPWLAEPTASLSYDEAKRDAIERFQRRYVERLLADASGNVSEAARRAGMTRAALQRILRRLGVGAGGEEAAS